MSDQSSETQEAPLASPGAQLAKARKQKKLTHAKVAERLHLSVQCIKDIESDDYQHLSAAIYVRGYLRAYARLLDLEAETLLSAFNTLGFAAQFETASPTLSYVSVGAPISRRLTGQKRHFLRWATVGIVMLLLLLIAAWWRGQSHNPHAILPPGLTVMQTVTPTAIAPDNTDVPVAADTTKTKTVLPHE